MAQFKASVVYGDAELKDLTKCVHDTFHMNFKIAYVVFCLALIVFGVYHGWDSTIGLICISFGVFLIPSYNLLEKSQRDRAVKSLNGRHEKVEYVFYDNRFSVYRDDVCLSVNYSDIIRMVEEDYYLYLFPNTAQAFMINKASMNPTALQNLKNLLVTKVGLQWTKPFRIWTLNVKQYIFNQRNTRWS